MFPLSFLGFIKYLIGILLLQGVTVLLVYTALKTTDSAETWPLFAGLGMAVAALTALWFNAIAESVRKQSLARAQASFSREREKIRVRAEQEKTKEFKSAQRQINKEKQRSQTGSNVKTGIMIGGAVSAGVLLMMTQMVTLGLLTLTTAGGAALGYGVRARQDRLAAGARNLLGKRERDIKVIEATPEVVALEPPPSRERPSRARRKRGGAADTDA